MAELTPKERLQPSLLDRLTDDEPDKLRNHASDASCRRASSVRACGAISVGCSTPLTSQPSMICPHTHRSSAPL